MNPELTFSDKIKLFPLWILTLLPLRFLYVFSDLIFLIVYYIVRYRKKVVVQNIRNAFPLKSEEEKHLIIKKFYHYLCDYFIESIYLLNMSANECNKRYIYENVELLEKYSNANKSIILATSHYGNWEWASNAWLVTPYRLFGIYKHLSNPLFDKLFIFLRGKYGSLPVPMKHTLRVVTKALRNNEVFALYLLGDQRPNTEDIEYWTTFLNQDAPIITGIEKLAKKFNFPVVFLEVQRVKRGYYKVIFREIAENPLDTKAFEITENYIRKVEEIINKIPEFWLWSHKRWKHDPKRYKPKVVA